MQPENAGALGASLRADGLWRRGRVHEDDRGGVATRCHLNGGQEKVAGVGARHEAPVDEPSFLAARRHEQIRVPAVHLPPERRPHAWVEALVTPRLLLARRAVEVRVPLTDVDQLGEAPPGTDGNTREQHDEDGGARGGRPRGAPAPARRTVASHAASIGRRPRPLPRCGPRPRLPPMRRAPRLLEAGALAAILLAQALLFSRGIDSGTEYDEGVYLGSLDALRAGQHLGTDIFAAQPPGFYLVLQGAAAVFGNSVEGVRTGILVLALLGSVGAFVALRAVAGPVAGLLAAAFLVIAPPIPLFGVRVLSDLPALDVLLLGLAAAALAGAGLTRRREWSFAAGFLFVAACSIKLSVLAAAPAFVLLLLRGRRRADLAWAGIGGGIVLVGLVLLHAGALGELWTSVVDYHQRLRRLESLSGSASLLRQVAEPGAAFTWIMLVALVLAVVHTLADRRRHISPFLVLAVSGVVFVAWHRPLFEHHVVAASVGLALCAAEPIGRELARSTGARRLVVAVIVAVLLAGGYVQQAHRVATELPAEDARRVADAAVLAARTRPRDFVVSDEPILAYRARRPMPGNVIDTSAARFGVGLLTDGDVLRAVDAYCAQAVVAGRAFTGRPRLLAELGRRFAVVDRNPLETLYLDRTGPCLPNSRAAGDSPDSP